MAEANTFYAVENCSEDGFDFLCPVLWAKLEQTGDENVRACAVCEKSVYMCKTDAELEHHVEAGHCVAVDHRKKIEAKRDAEVAEIRNILARPYVGYIAPKK